MKLLVLLAIEKAGSTVYTPIMARKSSTLMTVLQAKELRRLALDAYELEAYSPNLTKAEAEMRIRVLRAKLKLMSEPPHTQ